MNEVLELNLDSIFNSNYSLETVKQERTNEITPLSMAQMSRPMYLIFGLLGIATIIFIAEIIIFKWKGRQHGCKYRNNILNPYLSAKSIENAVF